MMSGGGVAKVQDRVRAGDRFSSHQTASDIPGSSDLLGEGVQEGKAIEDVPRDPQNLPCTYKGWGRWGELSWVSG